MGLAPYGNDNYSEIMKKLVRTGKNIWFKLNTDYFSMHEGGSSTATDESGIIFGGANGSANTGTALIWNGDYNSNDGRLAISNTVASNATSATVNYYIAGVFDGTSADAATAQADHRGNIRVDSSNDIFIYV